MTSLEVAQQWTAQGIAVFPCLSRSKSPAVDRWNPYRERLPRGAELSAWFSSSSYNLAVVCGWRGLVVVDFDSTWLYSTWLAGLDGAQFAAVMGTYRVTTRRGVHVYYLVDEPTEPAKLEGIDVKAAGGYVLAPPSVHPSGHCYTATGNPAHLAHLARVEDVLPEYANRAASWVPSEPDIWDTAWRERGNGASQPGAIERIKARYAIADLLPGAPRNDGHRVWHAVCPLHGDTNPSLAVYPDGHWKCFGCGAYGDVIDLYAAIRDLSLPAAIAALDI